MPSVYISLISIAVFRYSYWLSTKLHRSFIAMIGILHGGTDANDWPGFLEQLLAVDQSGEVVDFLITKDDCFGPVGGHPAESRYSQVTSGVLHRVVKTTSAHRVWQLAELHVQLELIHQLFQFFLPLKHPASLRLCIASLHFPVLEKQPCLVLTLRRVERLFSSVRPRYGGQSLPESLRVTVRLASDFILVGSFLGLHTQLKHLFLHMYGASGG